MKRSDQIARGSLPNLAQENYAGIASSEVLVRSIQNLTLPRLSDFIPNHDEVDAIGINIIQWSQPASTPPLSGGDRWLPASVSRAVVGATRRRDYL